jgi:signal transduction histidine kinase
MTLDNYIQIKLKDYIYHWTTIVFTAGPIVIIALIPLDFFVSPSHFREFLHYRLMTAFCLFGLFYIRKKVLPHIDQSVFFLAAGIVAAVMVALMIRALGGHQSYYYGGIILVAIFCLGLVPLPTRSSIIIAATVYGIYLVPILFYDKIVNRPFFISANFLVFSCIASLVLLLYFSHKRLIKEFSLQYEVERYRDELEKRVAEEVARSREKDGIMVKQAHLANLGELAAGVTHEINTPLTYIKGNIELLRSELAACAPANNAEIVSLFSDIEEGVARISFIVESMKELTGYSNKAVAPTNIFSTVIYANRLIHNRAKHIANIFINDRPFSMALSCDAESYMAPAKGQSIEQVWVVIINNALDELAKCERPFHERFIKITIGGTHDAVTVLIKDNAGGIPDPALDKVFEMFFSTKAKSGTGLGLYIAKTIVESHGGTIRAGNEENGAVFTITLPTHT